jgi:guanylate kinase
MDRYPDAITIFVHPGSLEELRGRLIGRGTESQQALEQRLQQAHSELGLAHRYRYQVVNDDLARAVRQICDILTNQWEIDRND